MTLSKWIGAGWLLVTLSMANGKEWAAPQAQQQEPQYTPAEYNALQAERAEKDPQAKIKLLKDFETEYPGSVFALYIYHDQFVTYYLLKNYPQSIRSTDKLLALGDRVDLETRVHALAARAQAYCVGSGDSVLQTGDAHEKARDAALRGIQTLTEWQAAPNIADQQFSAYKENLRKLFSSVLDFADASLKGDKSAPFCKMPPPPPPESLGFDHMINDLKTEQQNRPQVR